MIDTPWWERLKVDVPEGVHGRAKVERFTVDQQGATFHQLRCLINGFGARGILPGTYTRLSAGGVLWMSDTPAEIRDHLGALGRVQDSFRAGCAPRVLLHGLGLGVVLRGAFEYGAAHVTVVERDPDVLALVGPHWKERYGDRLALIEGDALTWCPPRGQRWDVVWHDIWPTICGDNLRDMHRLHRRFGRRAGWQGSWCRRECEARR